MSYANRHSAILLKLLILVFTLNVAFSYGACCIEPLDTEQGQSEISCHSKAEKTAQSEQDECCDACIMMAVPISSENLTANYIQDNLNSTQLTFISSNTAPPLRPPITHFS